MNPVTSASQQLRLAGREVPLDRRLRDLEAILGITRAMAAEPDLTRLLVLLAAASSKVLEVERTSIWVVDTQNGDLFTHVAEKTEGLRVPRGAGIVGAVAEAGEPLLIADAYSDTRFNPEVDKKTGFHTREILCLPLKDIEGRRVVGVLQSLNKTGNQKFSAYDVELAGLIVAQAGVVLEQAALREQALEKERLQAEMDLARSIQQRLLPQANPQLAGLQIAGCNHPATETSGDYYDFVPLPDGRLAVIVADVTGHGLGAALIMTAARAFARALCVAESDPAKILAAVNQLLAKDLEAGNFLSLCLAAFNPTARTLTYASAGHDPPLVFRPAENAFAELESTGPLLGIIEDAEFAAGGPLDLRAGDVLVFMTDGLFECMNSGNETFGKERLKDIIRQRAAGTASEILDALLQATTAWTQNRPPRDDITAVVVKVS